MSLSSRSRDTVSRLAAGYSSAVFLSLALVSCDPATPPRSDNAHATPEDTPPGLASHSALALAETANPAATPGLYPASRVARIARLREIMAAPAPLVSALSSSSTRRSAYFLPDPETSSPKSPQDSSPGMENLPPDLPARATYPHSLAIARKISSTPKVANAEAMANYPLTLATPYSPSVEMVAIPGGKFFIGSPESEPERKEDELRKPVEVSPFWISQIEIPWSVYRKFMENGRARGKNGRLLESRPTDKLWDITSQPTAPYTTMNLGMGNGYEDAFPAIAMSRHAANKFCEWLSAQTGQFYRLPTEAEWEFACRAQNNPEAPPTPWSFGANPALLPRNAWFYDNSNDQYQRTGRKPANAFGLHDMHGNVAEWVLDSWSPDERKAWPDEPGVTRDPLLLLPPDNPGIVKGGSWDDDPPATRSAARRPSSPNWNARDPQNPKSLWYLTDAPFVGLRIVRPLAVPSPEKMHRIWNSAAKD